MVDKNADKNQASAGRKVDKLVIRPTRITPLIYFDPEGALLELRGKSLPLNDMHSMAQKTLLPISNWNISIQAPQNAFLMLLRDCSKHIKRD